MTANDAQRAAVIPEFARGLATSYGDRVAMESDARTLTYRALESESATLARSLLARGVGKGSRVGLLAGNSPEWAIGWFAIARIGAVVVPLSTFAKGPELVRVVRHADLSGVIAQRSWLGQDFVERFEAGLMELGSCSGPELWLADVPYLRWIAVNGGPLPRWARPLDWLDGTGAPIDDEFLRRVEAEVDAEDVATIIYTSGTSADPKGVVHTQSALMTKVHYLREMLAYDRDTIQPATMPFFWVGGQVMTLFTTLETGGKVTCAEVASTYASAAPGGTPIGSATSSSTDASTSPYANLPLTPSLGMTETYGMWGWGTVFRAGEYTVASPIDVLQPGFEMKVVDEDGKPVPDGARGEIILRGPTVTRGLQKVPRETVFDEDGFYRTGDLGEVEGNRVHFVGRAGEMIKTSGANVSPAEVEREMLDLDGVAIADVVGIDDPERGQVVAAVVVPDPDVQLDPEVLREELKKRLSSYKVPRTIIFVTTDEIPMTPSLKVRKNVLATTIQERVREKT